ncbi:MAG: metallophosphoesterase family protein [Candidatus Hermodarchaeota archaeon]
MHVSKEEKPYESIIVNPNLGRPIFLNIDRKLKKKEFQTEILIISDVLDPKEFRKKVDRNIKLAPVLDYQWKYRDIYELKKKISEKAEGFWVRRHKKKIRKRKQKIIEREIARDEIDFKSDDVDYKFKKLKVHPYRGNALLLSVIDIKEISTIPISSVSYLDKLAPQDYLLKYSIFGNLTNFYLVSVKFAISKEVKNFLKERTFVMFDIISSQGRINFHSIVISKRDWKNFTFIHATDLHLAERNDRIYSIVKKWTESSVKRSVDDFFDTVVKKLKLKKKDNRDKTITDMKIPLRKRLVNPNNQFRKFIKIINRRVFRNEVDFIVLTGDLVDYTVLSRLAKKVRKLNEFKYEESNWKIFKDILLNSKHQKQHKGAIKAEELLCPIFTTVGNHDYRPYHYDLTWGEMYTKIGLNAAEAIALNELFSASPITALVKSTMALKGYLSEINPSFNYSLTLGNNNFIFLNTGSDSFKNIRDLLTGHPSVTGIAGRQINYLENIINNKIQENSNVFLFLHGPPINTGEKRISIKLFEKKGGRFIKEKIDDFKESVLRKLGQSSSDARLDKMFNVKYGTISSNWEKLVKFCKDYCTLTLSGHTHTLREFRLEDPEIKTRVYDSPPFSLKKIENPAAVYYDIYSELYTDYESIEKNRPFIVQTPALGLGGYKNPETAGAFRIVEIKDGKLNSFKVEYINR